MSGPLARAMDAARYDAPARGRIDEQAPISWLLVILVLGIALFFGIGLREVVDRNGGFGLHNGSSPERLSPVPPRAVDKGPGGLPSVGPRQSGVIDREILRQPMSFVLAADGTLRAIGSIEPGAAGRLEAELKMHGADVRRISLNSPGGALDDAIVMARMLRERGIATVVEDGAICASSCPLVMAGGVTRTVGRRALLGLHQFYIAGDAISDPARAMADAQMTTARISRHLNKMGIDPALWLHALDTPPGELYYLSVEDMRRYRLVASPESLVQG
ncbi:hypothetical protein [Chelativorans salis]|uniref:Clp protease n=1 Tax=Chelativorans salis TaxID=2978478 RepID=A0ABT2LPI8_9HYPH|nr:hypothetical protein [Chelativorans sp. EGI FJ00035]MCT7376475.1 hypothetical protein [Chelativorans sp. EGI FJ00035]